MSQFIGLAVLLGSLMALLWVMRLVVVQQRRLDKGLSRHRAGSVFRRSKGL